MSEKPTKRLVAKSLRLAARAIDDYGFRKCGYGNMETGFCTIGAINYVTHGVSYCGNHISLAARHALMKRLNGAYDTSGIAHFNDSSSTKKEDMTGLLRRTARELEHGGEL